MFYVLKVKVAQQHLYYAIDTKLTISKNIQDAMIFRNKGAAELFAGTIESALEEAIQAIVTVYVMPVDIRLILTGAVPTALIEQF